MTPVAVIGVGSYFGFDRLGREVVAQLRERARATPGSWRGVRLETGDRLGAPLLAQMRGAECVILVDAIEGGEVDGVVRFDGRSLEPEAGGISSHGFGLAQTLATGAQLDELPDEVVVLGLGHGGDAARPPRAHECERLADAVQAEIARFRSGRPPRWQRGLHAAG